jgi:hypothetical protein
MSPSTRSRPASPSSPETGAATEPKAKAKADRAGDAVAIELQVSRQRALGWAVFGTIAGVLFILKLGTVGVWGGYLLIAIGLYRAFQLVQSYRNPAGTIRVSASEVSLPRGLHIGKPVVVPPAEVTAVYFLRRSVPWNRHAPVLVVEIGKRALAFPRDWFASETEQRQVLEALVTACPVLVETDKKAKAAAAAAG